MSTKQEDCHQVYILAVDDSPDNLTLLEIVLDDPHYDLELLESGQAALEKVSQKVPDLILLDVMMPEMDGLEVTRRIRQDDSLPHIPIVLLTAYDQVNVSAGFDAGADDFIRKPFDIDELQVRVRSLTQVQVNCQCSSVRDLSTG